MSPRDGRCRGCGAVGRGRREVDLVLPDGERVPVERTLTLGRGPGNDLRLDDPTVSREHAQIELIDGCAFLSDRGSRFGTLLDGRRVQAPTELRAGMQITLGDLGLAVHGAGEAPAMTLSVPAGMSVILEGGAPRRVATAPGATRPRLRSGWSLKRLDAGPGYVLKDHRSSTFHRLDATDGALVTLLDGQHDVRELVAEATKRAGDEGPARLARLLAELADRGLLADVPDRGQDSRTRAGWLRAALTPRELALPRAGAAVTAIYRRGGYLLFTRAGLAALAATALMGLGAFVALIAAGSDTPLVVNHRLGLGALAFLLARLVIVLAHELAHGLAAESAGRGVVRAGLKWVLVFPYAFVDVSDAWFDTVGRRIAIALAGPGSDLVLGGACALACALMAPGTGREVLFQAALAGYLGALFNLNPLLERDGYHVLADVLGEPGLRRRAALRTRAILAGRVTRADSEPVLWRYGLATLCWSALTVALAIAMSLRYYHRLVSVAPRAVVWTLLAAFYLVLALPLAFSVLAPLRQRRTGPQVIGDG